LKRKLTTILSADVAGYSRLMGHDEEGTHARVAALGRELLEPAIDAHGGTLIKKTGDGLLAEFASVVEAVRYAIEVQQGAAERNAGFSPDQHIAFRIGINLGDVIVEAGDIFGDGVNVAVRLEGLAEPGGIVVSRAVREHVRDKLKLTFEDLGEQLVRNIARPVHAFHVRPEGSAPERTGNVRNRSLRRGALAAVAALAVAMVIQGAVWWTTHPGSLPALTAALSRVTWASQVARTDLAARLSIVVLPFANLSGDPAGVFCRRHHREFDHGSFPRAARQFRGRARHRLHLQG